MPLPLGILASSATFPEFEIITGTSVLTSDATYYYTTFNANATFRIKNSPLTADVVLVGAGAGALFGGQANSDITRWETSSGYSSTYQGPGGGAGGEARTYTSSVLNPLGQTGGTSDTFTVTIGAGGFRSAGTATNLLYPNNYQTLTQAGGGSVNLFGNGGTNASYTTTASWKRGVNGYWDLWQYGAVYQPFFGIGGGGAGAGGNGTSAQAGNVYPGGQFQGAAGNGGPGIVAIDGVRYGDGGGGIAGGYIGGTDYYGVVYPTVLPVNMVGTRGGDSAGLSSTGAGGNGAANRGGSGGSGWTNSGSGGSGRIVIRYLRSAVGG